MSCDSDDDDILFEQICQLVNTNMDSIILRYPKLWGLTDLPERNSDYFDFTLNYSPDEFRSQFQMSRRCFDDLLSKLARSCEIRNLEKKLLFSLWMLTTSGSYESVGSRFNYSKSSAHTSFNEILDAILVHFADYVKWPSPDQYLDISQAFKDQTGGYIPGIVGAIDSCHLEMKQPKGDPKEYHSGKCKYSIILQAVCDHRRIFTDVYVGAPGSLSYENVFRDSNICNQIDTLLPGEYHLVGNSSFPLMRNLVTAFPDNGLLSEEKSRFNNMLSGAGTSINRALSNLKARFQKLEYLDTPNPGVANKIVCTCITLHNHIRMFEADEDDEEFAEDPILPAVYITDEVAPSHMEDRKNPGYIKRNYLMSLYD